MRTRRIVLRLLRTALLAGGAAAVLTLTGCGGAAPTGVPPTPTAMPTQVSGTTSPAVTAATSTVTTAAATVDPLHGLVAAWPFATSAPGRTW